MKIGFDYQTAAGRGGNARYTRGLVEHLAISQDSDEFYLYDFVHGIRKRGLLPSDKHVHSRFVYLTPPYAPRDIQSFNDWVTRTMSRFNSLDLFHFTNPQNMTNGRYDAVVTVHDMSTFTDESFAKSESHKTLERKLSAILHETKAIIAVSEYTKRDLVENFGADSAKITVIYEAADERFYPNQDMTVGAQFGVSKFILYAGQLQPRKNLINLINAFSIMRNQYLDVSLILVGNARDEEYKRKLQEAITKNNLKDAVVFAGVVDDATLRKLYSATECFIYPSLFEGFGLPPLEAMQCGAPVIVTNTTSLPEVVGDAGILVDPHDASKIAEAIGQVLGDKVFQSQLRAASIARARVFTWGKSARETLAVYKKYK